MPLTREQRLANLKKGREAAAARRAAKANGGATTDSADLVPSPAPQRKPSRQHKRPAPPAPTPPSDFSTSDFISAVGGIPIDSLTFDDCTSLMSALMAAYDSLGSARKQKREQLDAGSHIAHCTTCERPIDISKSGGFQCLTRRDKFFQPYNAYFCSQNCVIAEGMKGKMRPTPGKHNQAGA